MKLRQIITAIAILALPFAASAATFVVPAVANAPGAYGSVWQSEVTLHSTSPAPLTVTLRLRDGGTSSTVSVTLAPRSTQTLQNIVKTSFGKEATQGALEIGVADADARRLAITSRTFNLTATGEYGQDIPAVRIDDASTVGDIVAIAGPAVASNARFNFGLYATTDASVKWELIRADGTVAATRNETYSAGVQRQYSSGASTFFGVTAENNDNVHATVVGGRAIFFGSAIDQQTGDPTFVPGFRTRDTILINFLGVDIDENGTVDIADADRDGVLDAPLEIASMFPNFFRIVAQGEFGETVTFALESAPSDSATVSPSGTVQAAGYGDLKGQRREILVRATAGGTTTTLHIPVHYR